MVIWVSTVEIKQVKRLFLKRNAGVFQHIVRHVSYNLFFHAFTNNGESAFIRTFPVESRANVRSGSAGACRFKTLLEPGTQFAGAGKTCDKTRLLFLSENERFGFVNAAHITECKHSVSAEHDNRLRAFFLKIRHGFDYLGFGNCLFSEICAKCFFVRKQIVRTVFKHFRKIMLVRAEKNARLKRRHCREHVLYGIFSDDAGKLFGNKHQAFPRYFFKISDKRRNLLVVYGKICNIARKTCGFAGIYLYLQSVFALFFVKLTFFILQSALNFVSGNSADKLETHSLFVCAFYNIANFVGHAARTRSAPIYIIVAAESRLVRVCR